MMIRYGRAAIAAFCTSILAAAPAWAQEYPSHIIQLVVGYTPGGGTDTLARLFADKVGARLGQKIIVENRPGANGNIGTSAVATAAPDGYTILLGNIGPIAVNPNLYKSMPHDPRTSLDPVTQLASAPLAILVNASIPVKTLDEFVAYAKERPGQVTYSSAGSGTSNQLAAELLNLRAGIKLSHIPYRGAAQAMTALISGEVAMFAAPLPSALPHIQSGKIRALAVTGAKRSPVMPDVPTAAEAGFPTLEMTTWYGILAPKGTPPAIVAKLNREFADVAKSPEITKWLADDGGAEPVGSSPEAFKDFLATETAKWAEVVKAASISIE
ncbi:Bug family tripartite tricarboxylate transporter substrate binding protein [Microvirga sp. 2TAF3]|uniref:Bug family tripartite tricarboxylate transporter substrate binding protein n=1 Tax=Microvirga sp. 2TAF3 TaxID=3233014 RepID=UPI003F9DCE41